MPTGPGKWTGTNPILPQLAMWKPWVLDSPSEFRPPPPPAYDAPQKAAELVEIKNFPHTAKTNSAAYFWEYAVGGLRAHQYWAEQIGRLVMEYRLGDDPPLAARAYALQNIAVIDSAIACWDGKYTYWAIRPFQLDPAVKKPSPKRRGSRACGLAPIIDIVAGAALGRAVAEKVIERAKHDGSQ